MSDKFNTMNGEGYSDPALGYTLSRSKPDKDEDVQFKKLIKTIVTVCDLAGFKVEGRISLKNKKSGRIWR